MALMDIALAGYGVIWLVFLYVFLKNRFKLHRLAASDSQFLLVGFALFGVLTLFLNMSSSRAVGFLVIGGLLPTILAYLAMNSSQRRWGRGIFAILLICWIVVIIELQRGQWQVGEITARNLATKVQALSMSDAINRKLAEIGKNDNAIYEPGPLFDSRLWYTYEDEIKAVGRSSMRNGYCYVPIGHRDWHSCLTGFYRVHKLKAVFMCKGGQISQDGNLVYVVIE
jgi:hypothetical protein